jgi:hypothetical protein
MFGYDPFIVLLGAALVFICGGIWLLDLAD